MSPHHKEHMSFWKKERDPESGVTVYYCEKHGFRTTSKVEVAEHEEAHAFELGTGVWRGV